MFVGTLLFLSFFAQEIEKPKLPKGVLAIVDGDEITVQQYKDYLWNEKGKLLLQHFVDRLLLKKKGEELGIVLDEEEVKKKVEERVQREIEGSFGNSISKWREHLSKQWRRPEEYKAQLLRWYRMDLLRERCVLKSRKVTEETLKKQFELDYGKSGIIYNLRQIFVSVPRKQGGKIDPGQEAKAREKAERILRELKDNAVFEELVSLYSDDRYSKRNGGRIPYYRHGKFGKEFDAAVVVLSEESPLSGVVKTKRGFHIIQLLKKRVTKFEDVRTQLAEIVRNKKPTPKEKYDFVKELRENTKIIK